MIRLVLLAALFLIGCAPAPEAPEQPAVPLAPPQLTLRIPELAVDVPMLELRRDAEGVLQVPPVEQPDQVGWYADGVVPGNVGPALVAGHVSGRPAGSEQSVPGVFAELSTLAAGDTITVERDEFLLTFEVYQVETVRKDEFPTGRVYGDTQGPELRLVTCGGAFDPAARSYEENVIVYARLATEA